MRPQATHGLRARVTGAIVGAAVIVAVSGCTAGPNAKPIATAKPHFDGSVEQLRSGTVGSFEDLSIGLMGVWSQGASLALWGNGPNETLDLNVGEEGGAQGVHLRLCAVWVDTSVTDDSPPGSDASQAYYVVGRGESAPNCPRQT